MTEATLKGKLLEKARSLAPEFVWIRHEDRFTSGIPDLSAAGLGYASWWEIKYANPNFLSNGAQELMLLRLSNAMGRTFYIVYCDIGAVPSMNYRHIRIVTPKQFPRWDEEATHIITGFHHEDVVAFVKETHRG